MQTKLSKLEAAAKEGRWRDALRIAARFPVLGDHKAAIVRAHEAYENERFYSQIGRDADQLKSAGIAALCDRYHLDPYTGEKLMTIETKLTGGEISKLTAILTGGGYKRAASKAKAIERLRETMTEKVGEAMTNTYFSDVVGADDYLTATDWLRTAFEKKRNAAIESLVDDVEKDGIKVARAAPKAKLVKKAADGPRSGTKSRITFDLMRAKKGTTAKEVVAAGGMNESLSDIVIKFADRYGFAADKQPDGRQMRYFLRAA